MGLGSLRSAGRRKVQLVGGVELDDASVLKGVVEGHVLLPLGSPHVVCLLVVICGCASVDSIEPTDLPVDNRIVARALRCTVPHVTPKSVPVDRS